MLRDPALIDLVALLSRRQVRLYHACQFQDFRSYLQLGGIPSRKKLEDARMPFTPFTTDVIDRENGVWDKVFVNLEDFGRGFARGAPLLPNPYGPILILLDPQALLGARDVAVCLRSAGAPGFDRARAALKSVADVERLFYRSRGESGSQGALKFRRLLREEFGPEAQSVEVSCTFDGSVLAFGQTTEVLVDPYHFDGELLERLVRRETVAHRHKMRIRVRPSKVGVAAYRSLLDAVRDRAPLASLPERLEDGRMKGWARQVLAGSRLLRYNLDRFASYLLTGTVEPLQEQAELYAAWPDSAMELLRETNGEDAEDRRDLWNEESELIESDLHDDRNDWARSSADGWFYGDEEEEESDFAGADCYDDEMDESFGRW